MNKLRSSWVRKQNKEQDMINPQLSFFMYPKFLFSPVIVTKKVGEYMISLFNFKCRDRMIKKK